MDKPLTPEEERQRLIASLPKPLKPIPPEIMAEILENQLPYEEAVRELTAIMQSGGVSLEPYLEELHRKSPEAR